MVAALFECSDQTGRERYYFEGKDPKALVAAFYQLDGPEECPSSVSSARSAVNKFLERYYDDEFTLEDLRRFSLNGGSSSFRCLSAREEAMPFAAAAL